MQAAIAPRGDARTFLTHFVGSGLDDDRYVVEKFRSLANGDIVPVDQPARNHLGAAWCDQVFGGLWNAVCNDFGGTSVEFLTQRSQF